MDHARPHNPDATTSPEGTHAIHPAGAVDAEHHHGHVIVPASTLMAVLLALLFFTLLTVGASQAEELIATTWHVVIPAWVNVFVALSIAVIKTVLVVLFFMQLKYDNPTNGMIFIFCIMTVTFFLGFTMLDLGNRGTIDRFKEDYITAGGTGIVTPAALRGAEAAKETGAAAPSTAQPITKIATDAAVLEKDFNDGERKKWTVLHSYLLREDKSDAQQSRPRVGVTLPGVPVPPPAPIPAAPVAPPVVPPPAPGAGH